MGQSLGGRLYERSQGNYMKLMTITYFGYGSLVNVATLGSATVVQPGTLTGWVREWRIRGANMQGQGVCALSVAPEATTSIRGVSAREPKAGLEKLDKREGRYHRIDGVGSAFRCDAEGKPGDEAMFLYQSKPEHYGWGCAENPILQSYVDCVLAGFHAFWGEEGIRHFIETTRGWHVPILADRNAPVYPRAVLLQPEVQEMIDDHLADQKVTFLAEG
ncbi:gamma-glutamylcyclotransferase family protein [Labrenzia sp. CE80]|uniref:gamma-glutamylcyclotransferase family protein n=1 Tax=Labrenzia sp. CE80 TaxID=1788986 RepID=UPI001AD8C949|nr:gamma-glutamylcyclotransferase family protein [Labrenzia sp. CE80]